MPHACIRRTPFALTKAVVMAACLLSSPQALAIFGIEPHFRHGAVYARAIVLSESGNPIYVEYDALGEEVAELGEVTGDLANLTIMSGVEFRSHITVLQEFRAANDNGIARDAALVTSAQYDAATYLTVADEAMSKPTLKSTTRSVLIRDKDQRFLPNADQLVLLEFPVDLTATASLDDTVTSLLLDEAGLVHTTSEHNIGFRVGFYGDDGSRIFGRSYDDVIHGPVSGVLVETGVFVGGRTVTGNDGKYAMTYFVPPCPGFTFLYSTPTWAELHYRNFGPRGSATIPYYLQRPGSTFCNGLGAFPPSLTLGGLMTQVAVIGILASQARPNIKDDFPVDVMMLTGNALVTNRGIEGLGDVTLGDDTSYDANEQTFDPIARSNFDFDGDGEDDRSILGRLTTVDDEVVFEPDNDGPLQGIYLSSGTRSPDAAEPEDRLPDFTRLADAAPYPMSQGLLSSLSENDLKDTDIYVFRRSNGMLITEREGLNASETGALASGVNSDNGRFFYRILIRGPRDGLSFFNLRGLDFATWQSGANIAPELHAREADHLRAGEEVQIVAINRITGYIGTTTTPLMSASEGGTAEISFPIDEIVMGPPNLKIWRSARTRSSAASRGANNASTWSASKAPGSRPTTRSKFAPSGSTPRVARCPKGLATTATPAGWRA